MTPLIDTHNHLQAGCFDADLEDVMQRARSAGVCGGLITGGSPADWEKCLGIAGRFRFGAGLGTHPLSTALPENGPETAEQLRDILRAELQKKKTSVAAVAEIGLDGFVKSLDFRRQEEVFAAQLKVARDFSLPVSLHARNAVDHVIKWLRRIPVPGGAVHAFNGSEEQANRLIGMGFRLGYGGAMTYEGSRRIRRLAALLPAEAIVLETDCPDMPSSERRDAGLLRTEPSDLAGYAEELAALRGVPAGEFRKQLLVNSLAAFPRLKQILPECCVC